MTVDEYLRNILITGNKINNLDYLKLGIFEELGEISGKIKKYRRGDYKKEEFKNNVKKEIGDLLWYLVLYSHVNKTPLKNFNKPRNKRVMESVDKLYALANFLKLKNNNIRGKVIKSMVNSTIDLSWSFGYTIDDICKANIAKIQDRLKRNKIKGSGDER